MKTSQSCHHSWLCAWISGSGRLWRCGSFTFWGDQKRPSEEICWQSQALCNLCTGHFASDEIEVVQLSTLGTAVCKCPISLQSQASAGFSLLHWATEAGGSDVPGRKLLLWNYLSLRMPSNLLCEWEDAVSVWKGCFCSQTWPPWSTRKGTQLSLVFSALRWLSTPSPSSLVCLVAVGQEVGFFKMRWEDVIGP